MLALVMEVIKAALKSEECRGMPYGKSLGDDQIPEVVGTRKGYYGLERQLRKNC
jgi:hypothetical protein